MSGGAARGFAHIGVLKVLVDNGVPIDMIAGTSAGAFVGGAFASGMSVDEISIMAAKVGWTNMVSPSFSPMGLLSNAPMGRFIEREFPVNTFEQLAIPFTAVGCDLDTGEEFLFHNSGDLAEAIRGSCAVPGVFVPLKTEDGRLIIDGGVISPVPADVVRRMGADIVIAVDLMACGATFRSRPYTGIGVMFQSAMLLLRTASRNQQLQADIVIVPQIAHLRPDQIDRRDEFIELGAAAAHEMIPEIRRLIS